MEWRLFAGFEDIESLGAGGGADGQDDGREVGIRGLTNEAFFDSCDGGHGAVEGELASAECFWGPRI